jgi:putative peptidoglycan lipid II flippase
MWIKFASIFKSRDDNGFTWAAFLIGGLSFVASFLGLLRDRILASNFGAGEVLDSYYAAFRLPDLCFNILIFGALSSAFVPVFSGYLEKNKKEAFIFANVLLVSIFLLMSLVSVLGIYFAPVLLRLIVPGFSEETLKTTIDLTRIMFLSPLILSVSGIFSGILTTFRNFWAYSLAPIFYNVGIILGIYFFVPYWGVRGLAFAVVLGALLHLLVQVPSSFAAGFRFRLRFGPAEKEGLGKVIRLMIPRSLSLLVGQFNLLFITIVASALSAGSLSVFNLANNLAGIPLTIFGAPFAVAVFPSLARCYHRKDFSLFAKIFDQALIRVSFLVIPTSVFILIFRAQLVRLALGSGQFDWWNTRQTSQVLGFLALSLFFQSLIPLVSRAFFAIHNTSIPFLAGLLATLVNAFLAFFLSHRLGIGGVALAFSISQVLYFLILLIVLYIKVGGLEDNKIISAFVKISLASLLGGVVAQVLKHLIGEVMGTETFLKILIQFGIGFLGGAMVFVFSGWFLGLRELDDLKSKVYLFLGRKEV